MYVSTTNSTCRLRYYQRVIIRKVQQTVFRVQRSGLTRVLCLHPAPFKHTHTPSNFYTTMPNHTDHATTDYEFLVATMKQNPLGVFAVGVFALSMMLFWVLEMILVFELDKVASAVIAKIKTMPDLLRKQSWGVDNCIICGLSVSSLARGCKLLVGTYTCICSGVSSFGMFLDAIFIVFVDMCSFPFV